MSPPLPSAPPAALPTGRVHTASNRWVNVGVFLAALVLVHCVTEAMLPTPTAGEVSEKLAYFVRHKDEFDAVFVGSSRVSAQIAPGVFDPVVAAQTGRPMRSFNFGVPSMYLPESLYVIDCILAQRPARLRWMFIELDEPRLRVEERAGLVHRELYWHGWRETALMNAAILALRGLHKEDRLGMLAHQWALFGRRWGQVGRAREWLETPLPPTATTTSLGTAADGYTPYLTTLGEENGGSKDMRQELRNYTAAAASLKKARQQVSSDRNPPALLRWLLAEKVRALRARNVAPVFLVAPVTTGEEQFLQLSDDATFRPLFAFNDPAAYPELYEPAVRADTMHLNAAGSLRLTRLLADRFSRYLAAPSPH